MMSNKEFKVTLRLSPNEVERLVKEETQKRRKARILQVREQCKVNAAKIRKNVREEKERLLDKLAGEIENQLVKENNEKLIHLEQQYDNTLKSIGSAHRTARNKPLSSQSKVRKQQTEKLVADNRYKVAMKKQLIDKARQSHKENKHIISRRAAIEAERLRAAEMASLPPPPPDPLESIMQQNVHIVKQVNPLDLNAFSMSHYHMLEPSVIKAGPDEQIDGKLAGEEEDERIREKLKEKKHLGEERLVRARIRGQEAFKKEHLKHEYEEMLQDLSMMQREDRKRRQDIVADLPKQVFIPPNRRLEEKADKQRNMEQEFEDIYIKNFAEDIEMTLDPSIAPDSPSTVDSLELSQKLGSYYESQKEATSEDQAETTQNKKQENILKKLLNRIKEQKAEHSVKMAEKLESLGKSGEQSPADGNYFNTVQLEKEKEVRDEEQLNKAERIGEGREYVGQLNEESREKGYITNYQQPLDEASVNQTTDYRRLAGVSVNQFAGVRSLSKDITTEPGKLRLLSDDSPLSQYSLPYGQTADNVNNPVSGSYIPTKDYHPVSGSYIPTKDHHPVSGSYIPTKDHHPVSGSYIPTKDHHGLRSYLPGTDVSLETGYFSMRNLDQPRMPTSSKPVSSSAYTRSALPHTTHTGPLVDRYIPQPTSTGGLNERFMPQPTSTGGLTERFMPQATSAGGLNERFMPQPTSTGGLNERFMPQPTSTGGLNERFMPQPTSTGGLNERFMPQPTSTGGLNERFMPQPTSTGGLNERFMPPPTSTGGLTERYMPQPTSSGGLNDRYMPQATSAGGLTERYMPQATTAGGLNDRYMPQPTSTRLNEKYLPQTNTLASGLTDRYSTQTTDRHYPQTTRPSAATKRYPLLVEAELSQMAKVREYQQKVLNDSGLKTGSAFDSRFQKEMDVNAERLQKMKENHKRLLQQHERKTSLAETRLNIQKQREELLQQSKELLNIFPSNSGVSTGDDTAARVMDDPAVRMRIDDNSAVRMTTDDDPAARMRRDQNHLVGIRINDNFTARLRTDDDFAVRMRTDDNFATRMRDDDPAARMRTDDDLSVGMRTAKNLVDQDEFLSLPSSLSPAKIARAEAALKTRSDHTASIEAALKTRSDHTASIEAALKTRSDHTASIDPERTRSLPECDDLHNVFRPRSLDMKDLKVTGVVSRLTSLRSEVTARDMAATRDSAAIDISSSATYQPLDRSKAPSNRSNAPSERFNVPSERFNAPSNRFNAPSNRSNAPSERFNAPSDRFNAPSDKFNAPTGTSVVNVDKAAVGSYAPIDTAAIRHKLDSIKKSLCFDDLEETITCSPVHSASVERFYGDDSTAADGELTSSSERGSPRLASALMDVHQSSLTSDITEELQRLRASQESLWAQPRLTWAQLLDKGPSVSSQLELEEPAAPEPELNVIHDYVLHDLSTIMEVDTPSTSAKPSLHTIHESQASSTDSFKTLRQSQTSVLGSEHLTESFCPPDPDSFITLTSSLNSSTRSSILKPSEDFHDDSFRTLPESQNSDFRPTVHRQIDDDDDNGFKTLPESQHRPTDEDSFRTLPECQHSDFRPTVHRQTDEDASFRTLAECQHSDFRPTVHRQIDEDATFRTLPECQHSDFRPTVHRQIDEDASFRTLPESHNSEFIATTHRHQESELSDMRRNMIGQSGVIQGKLGTTEDGRSVREFNTLRQTYSERFNLPQVSQASLNIYRDNSQHSDVIEAAHSNQTSLNIHRDNSQYSDAFEAARGNQTSTTESSISRQSELSLDIHSSHSVNSSAGSVIPGIHSSHSVNSSAGGVIPDIHSSHSVNSSAGGVIPDIHSSHSVNSSAGGVIPDIHSSHSVNSSAGGVIPGKAKRALEFSLSPPHPLSETSISSTDTADST